MNFIETYKVQHEVCDKILKLFWDNKENHKVGLVGDKTVNKKVKESIEIHIASADFIRHGINVFGGLPKFLEECVDNYFTKYVPPEQGWNVSIDENINIQHYKPNMGYPQPHFERTGVDNSTRALVWMLYLTDTPDGGTKFVHQKHTTECIKGDLIIWPPDFTHVHHGIISKTHEKTIMTGWLHWVEDGSS